MRLSRSPALVVSCVAACVLLPNLGGPPLWDDDEPRNAACSVAMLGAGDWLVPTFNGRLRVEKPALVNWLHLAGFAVAGVNETGARVGSAVLTIGTCVLTASLASVLGRGAAVWAGLVMATCLWTGVSGRAATPDAALGFFTTVALWTFVRGARVAGPAGEAWRFGAVRLSWPAAAGVGAACGFAMLAKGPVGLVLPLAALGTFCWWQAFSDPGRDGSLAGRLVGSLADAWRSLRPTVIVSAALAVALPWYAAVTILTEGAWLRDFLLVHNVGRFAAPMEGHSGSTLFYYPLVLLVGTFPWSIAWILFVGHAARTSSARSAETMGMRLAACWVAAWLLPFCVAGTKLPGYVWPAYPALAMAAGGFIAAWIRRPTAATDGWMRVAWGCLAASGVALAIGVPLVTRRYAGGGEWLGLIGILPLAGAGAAWALHAAEGRAAAAAAWAATACGTIGLLVGAGPDCVGHAGGTRRLFAAFEAAAEPVPLASFAAPASAIFYGSRVAPAGTVRGLAEPAEAAAFVADHPDGHVVVDARYASQVAGVLPAHYAVLDRSTSFPTLQEVVLFGPAAVPRLAAVPAPASRR